VDGLHWLIVITMADVVSFEKIQPYDGWHQDGSVAQTHEQAPQSLPL